jgi:hypothetical protein
LCIYTTFSLVIAVVLISAPTSLCAEGLVPSLVLLGGGGTLGSWT